VSTHQIFMQLLVGRRIVFWQRRGRDRVAVAVGSTLFLATAAATQGKKKKKKKEKKKKKQPTYDGSLAAHVHCFKRLRPATAPSWAFSVFISLAFNSRDATSSGRGKISRYWTALRRVCRATSKPFFFILG